MSNPSRRTILALAAAAGVQGLPSLARAQSAWPDKPVRLVVPYPPGGFTDVLGRILGEKLQGAFGQPVVIENRGGGGSSIGTANVARSPADGYSLLLVAADFAINESLMASQHLSYDARKDFAPVMEVSVSPLVLVSNPSFGPKTVAELVALAKARPGEINAGSGGNGTGAHLALELFKTRAGVNLLHVPYQGNGPATTALLAGQVQVMFVQYAVAKPHIDAGKLRALATPSEKRIPTLPDVPTISESGGALAGFDVQPWFGIVVASATPQAIVDKLNGELVKIMKAPDVRERLAALGAQPVTGTPQEFGRFIDSEITRWAAVVKASGAKIE